jgi:DNA-binding XRE family transcriptional regulator
MVKSKYQQWLTDDGLTLLKQWARRGLTDAEIAQHIGIRRPTLYAWKKAHPDIADALKESKAVADAKVEDAVYDALINGQTTKTTNYRMVKVDATELKNRRAIYSNRYRLDHESATSEEIYLATVKAIPAWEQIPMSVTETTQPVNLASAMKWLRNRDPDHWTDQSFRDLNKAQAEKARADAELAKVKAKDATSDTAPVTVEVVMPPGSDEEDTNAESDD